MALFVEIDHFVDFFLTSVFLIYVCGDLNKITFLNKYIRRFV